MHAPLHSEITRLAAPGLAAQLRALAIVTHSLLLAPQPKELATGLAALPRVRRLLRVWV